MESAITKLRFDIVKGSIIQSGVSSFGISAPFQLSASTGNKAVPLLVNGQDILYANGSKDSSDIVNLVIHRKGIATPYFDTIWNNLDISHLKTLKVFKSNGLQ